MLGNVDVVVPVFDVEPDDELLDPVVEPVLLLDPEVDPEDDVVPAPDDVPVEEVPPELEVVLPLVVEPLLVLVEDPELEVVPLLVVLVLPPVFEEPLPLPALVALDVVPGAEVPNTACTSGALYKSSSNELCKIEAYDCEVF